MKNFSNTRAINPPNLKQEVCAQATPQAASCTAFDPSPMPPCGIDAIAKRGWSPYTVGTHQGEVSNGNYFRNGPGAGGFR